MSSKVSKRTSKIESHTRELLKILLPEYEPIYNYRPDWLKNFTGYNLELDIYYPEIGVAVEVNGIQHILPYQKQKDAFKGKKCKENEVVLIVVKNRYEILDLQEKLSGCVPHYTQKDIPKSLFKRIQHYKPSKKAFFNKHIRKQIQDEVQKIRTENYKASIPFTRINKKLKRKKKNKIFGQVWTDEKAIDYLASLSKKLHPEDFK